MVRLISISGLNEPELEIFTKLSEVQLRHLYEPHGGLFIAESPRVALRALDAGCEPVALLVEDRHVDGEAAEVLDRCNRGTWGSGEAPEGRSRKNGEGEEMPGTCGWKPGGSEETEIPVYVGSYDVLTKLTGYALTRGLLCAMRRPPLAAPQEILGGAEEHASSKPARRIAVLENVMNPANVGSVFRNAAALGIDAVLLTDGCSDPLYRRTLRVSMGTTLQIPWAWIGRSLDEWQQTGLRWLHEQGFRTIAMALREDAVGIRDLRLCREEKAAILLGAEGEGLLQETIRAADDVVMIPMMRGVDSLNVAAASAVAFYALGTGSAVMDPGEL